MAQWLLTWPAYVESLWVNDSSSNEYTCDPAIVKFWEQVTSYQNIKHQSLCKHPVTGRSEETVWVSRRMGHRINVIKSHFIANKKVICNVDHLSCIRVCTLFVCVVEIENYHKITCYQALTQPPNGAHLPFMAWRCIQLIIREPQTRCSTLQLFGKSVACGYTHMKLWNFHQ